MQVHAGSMWECPVWSADGRLIFTKVVSPEAGKKAFLQSGPEPSGQSPVVFDTSALGPARNKEGLESNQKRANGLGAWEMMRGDLASFEVASGKETILIRNQPITGWWPSPTNSRQLVYAAIESFDDSHPDDKEYTLQLVDVITGSSAQLAQHLLLGVFSVGVSWSPDGTHIAYISSQAPKDNSPIDCYVIDISSKNDSTLLSKVVHVAQPGLMLIPTWTSDSRTVLLSDPIGIYVYGQNGKERLIRTEGTPLGFPVSFTHPYLTMDPKGCFFLWERSQTNIMTEVHKVDLVQGTDQQASRSATALAGYHPQLGIGSSADGIHIVYLAQSAKSPPDLWLAERDLSQIKRITTVNPELGQYSFGQTQLISWISDDGRTLHGSLLVPPDFQPGRPCPLIVNLYGGSSLSRTLNFFGAAAAGEPNSQLLSTRGYAVLLPDSPMDQVGTPMLELLKDVLPGISRAVELGFAKEDAVGIMGTSYGGYSALALLAQTNRFRAAIAIAPVVSLLDMYMWMDDDGTAEWSAWAVDSQGNMRATPWQRRDRYIDNSPLFFADRINSPVLLAVGGGDELAIPQARSMFVALKRLEKSAEYVEYPQGAHVVAHWPSYAKRDFANRMIGWFDRYLKQHD
jgi:acetyl esterase/lipase